MPPTPEDDAGARTSWSVRAALIVGGTVSLAFAVLGVILPLVPTTPFVLLAAGCYARAWEPAHRWLRSNRFFGPICRSGEEGRYLPPRAKAAAIVFTLLSFGLTTVFATQSWILRGVLIALCLAVTAWLASMPTEPGASS